MSFAEWSNNKKKNNVSQTAPQMVTQNDSEEKSSDKTTSGSFSEWSNNRRAAKTAQDWADLSVDLINEAGSYYSSWKDKKSDETQYNSYNTRLDNLLGLADSYRKQYANNQEAVSTIDSIVKALSETRSYIWNAREYYSQWETEKEYKTAYNDYTWRQKYQGNSYDQLQEMLIGMDDGEEKEWLKEYAKSDDVMTVDDHTKLMSEAETRLAELENEWRYKNNYSYEEKQAYLGEKKALEQQIEASKAGIWRLERREKYGGLKDNADFDTLSTKVADEPTAGFGIGLNDKWWGEGDPVYDYINNIDGTREKAINPSTMGHSPYSIYDYMDKDEIEIYNYLYNTEGEDAAKEYLDYIEYGLNARRTQKVAESAAITADKAPVLSSIVSIPANLVSGIGLLDVIGQNLYRDMSGEYRPIDYNRGAMSPSVMTSAIRGTVSQKIIDKTGVISLNEENHPVMSRLLNGKSLADVYQLGMSMADSMAVAYLTPLGQYGAILLGGSAGTQGMLDAVAKGATDEQALTMGVLNGAFEALFEYVSLDKLLKGNTRNVIKAFFQQGFVEGSEEFNTTFFNTMADILVMAEKSDYRASIQAYMDAGLSEEEATKEALKDKAIEMCWDFVGGFASGGIMGSTHTAVTDVIQNNNAKRVYGSEVSALVDEALEIDPNNKLAQKIQGKINRGGSATGNQIYNLVQQNEQAIRSQDMNMIQESAAQRLTELGETGDVSSIAAAVAKQASGEKVSRAEQQLIGRSKYGQRVLNELTPENIRSGEYSSDWAQRIGTNRINAEEYSRLIESLETPQEETENKPSAATTEVPVTVQAAPVETRQENTKATGQQTAKAPHEVSEAPTENTPVQKTETIEEASKKYGAQAGAMIHIYNEGQDVAKYDAAYRIAYDMGKSGVPLDYAMKSDGTSYLTEEQRKLAYNTGKDAADASAKARDEEITKGVNGKTGWKKGVVKGENVTGDDLQKAFNMNDSQVRAYNILSTIAEATGVDIVLYQSEAGADGKFQGAQGKYRRGEPGTIFIDINAGLSSIKSAADLQKYVMLRTFSHEFTHFVENWNPVQYNEFRRVVFDTIDQRRGENDYSSDELIGLKMEQNPGMSYEAASREVVAEAMTDILPDANFVQELADKHKTIFDKLREKLKEFAAKVKEYFNSIGDNPSREAKALKEQTGESLRYVENIVMMFDEIAVKAVENYQSNYAVEEAVQSTEEATQEVKEEVNPVEAVPSEPKVTNSENGYSITDNPEYGSIEVKFNEKPSEAIRDVLKANKFRWNGKRQVWYGKTTHEEIMGALDKVYSAENTKADKTKPFFGDSIFNAESVNSIAEDKANGKQNPAANIIDKMPKSDFATAFWNATQEERDEVVDAIDKNMGKLSRMYPTEIREAPENKKEEMKNVDENDRQEAGGETLRQDNDGAVLQPEPDGEGAARLLDEVQAEDVQGTGGQREAVEPSPERGGQAGRDGDRVDAAEVKALASGNQMIVEQVKLSNELAKLHDLRRAYNSSITAAKARLLEDQQKINTLESSIAKLKEDIKARVDTYSDGKFSMTIGKRTFTEKKEAGAALAAEITAKAKQGDFVTVGKFAGFELRVIKDGAEYSGLISGKQGYKFNVYTENTTYMVNHIIGVVEGLETKRNNYTERLADLRTDRDAQDTIISTPFAKQAELDQKMARYNEVMAILNPKEEQAIADDEQEQSREYLDSSEPITKGMTDEERYEILKDRSISLEAKTQAAELRRIEEALGRSVENTELLSQTDRKRLFRKIGEEFGVFKEYENADVHLTFEFSRNNMRESLSKQKKNYADFAKMLSCFDKVIESAVGIEVHNRNEEGYKYDPTLKDTYVLVSAFEDEGNIVPVKLEIKEFFDKNNSLYVAIALERIKIDEVVKQGDTKIGVTQSSRSSEISIADLFAKINPVDESFLKYVPKQFLAQAPVTQAISSAKTSIKQIPALFKDKNVHFEETNVDIGGGRFDLATEFLAEQGVKNYLFDPYNRPENVNLSTLNFLRSGNRADTATCANVLNVIAEPAARENVILEAAKAIKNDGTAYFMVYEGDGSGAGRETSSGWQNNRKTADYVGEIAQYFNSVVRKGKLIIATDPISNLPKASWEISPGNAIQYQQRTDTLTDREVLQYAASELSMDELSDGEKDALKIFNERLSKLEELQEKRLELGRLYKEQQFGTNVDRDAAKATRNRMQVLDEQIKRASEAVLSVEDKAVLKRVLQKARKVVEQQEREKGQAILKRWRDRRNNAAAIKKYRERIRADVDELTSWVLHPSNKDIVKHVPDALKNSVVPFLASINFTSKQQLRGGNATQADKEFMKQLNALKGALKQNMDVYGLYSGYNDIPPDFMDRLQTFIDSAQAIADNNSGEFIINKMTSEELHDLSKVVRTLKKFIMQMNRFHANAMYQHVYEAGDNSIEYMGQIGNAGSTGVVSNFMLWQQMRPAYAFERFGEGGMAIYDGLRRGQATLAFNTQKIKEFAEKTYTAEEVKAWEKEAKGFRLGSDYVKIPVSDIMSLYELSKRPQALGHILGKGIRVATYKDGKTKISDTGHTLTPGEMNQIINSLTTRQKEVADALQQFMAKQGGEWGNYVSVKRFGEEMFGEEHYFPIHSDGRHLQAKAEDHPSAASLYALLNMSFTKELKEEANNRIVLYSIFDVFANHMASMAQYNAFALPVLDALKWFNYQQIAIDEDGSKTVLGSVREQMDRVYGVPEETRPGSGRQGYAESFVINIIKAFNGTEAQGVPMDETGLKSLRRYNMAQVAYNFRVVVQQPLAITRAGMLVDYRSIIKGIRLSPSAINRNIEEMQKYSGIAAWKSLGFYDINISRGLSDIIKHKTTVMDKIGDVGMWGAEKADLYTWAGIWSACKEEVISKQGLRPSSEGFYEAVTKLFEDVIYKTQVVDSVLTKNEFLRSKGFWARAVGSFMSEPTTTASMLIDAYDKFSMDMQRGMTRQQAWKNNRKMIGRTVYVYAIGAVLLAAVQAAADALRDDDDYQTFFEKWLEAFGGNLVDEAMPLNKLPILSDFYEIMKELLSTWGVDTYGNPPRSVLMQWGDSLVKGSEIIHHLATGEETSYTWYGGAYKLLQALSGISGLPMAAATREIITAWNNIVGGMAPSLKVKTYEPSEQAQIKYAYQDGYLTAEEATEELMKQGLVENENEAYWLIQEWEAGGDYSRFDGLYDAVRNGGDFKGSVDELTAHGYTEKDLISKVKSKIGEWYKTGEVSKSQAVSMLEKYTDLDDDEITKTVNKWSCVVVTGIEYDDIKEEYMAGNLTASRATEMYVKYGGYSWEDADLKVKVFAWQKEVPNCDEITTSAIKDYDEIAGPAGISREIYYNAWVDYKDTPADYDEKGESIPYSKTRKVMPLINALPLTADQKTALALCWWSEATVRKYKLW